MKNTIKKTAIAFSATALLSGAAIAATDSLSLSGAIAKSVSVTFDVASLDLGDMTGTYEAGFTVVANTDYTVSVPAEGTLLNTDAPGVSLSYAASASKETSKVTIDPFDISPTQAAGNYIHDLTLTVSAI